MGMATASQWFFNFVVAKSTPTMFATLGKNGYGAYFVYGSFCFVMVIYTWFFVPETKGKLVVILAAFDTLTGLIMTDCIIRTVVGIYGRAFRTGYGAWPVYTDARCALFGG